MLAGGIGGTSGDILMHSLDTVKTRQQGDPHFPPKYTTMSDTYAKIFRQEGIRKGLYGGIEAAMLGSFPGTVVFFGTYEYCKRHLLDYGVNPSISFLIGGTFEHHLHAPVAFSDAFQVSWQILLHLLYMFPPKSSKLAYSSRDVTRTLSSTLDTITAQPGTQQRRSHGLKDWEHFTQDTRQPSFETCHFLPSNLHFMNKSKDSRRAGLVVTTSASGLRLSRPLPLAGWPVL